MPNPYKRDFSQHTAFPGTHGNPFDVVLHALDEVDRWPPLVFALVLLALSLPAAAVHGPTGLALWLFMLGDWALMRALPRFGLSFGPAQPPTFVLAVLRLPFALLPMPWCWLAQGVGTALVIYAFWWEPHRLTVTRQTLRSPKLHPAAPPIRLLHLGDLHLERFSPREQRLLDQVQALAPDIIVFSGDFLNLSYRYDARAHADCRRVLSQLAAPLGVYVVTGSPAVDVDEVIPGLLADLPVRWLRDERVTLTHHHHTLDVVGLACTHMPHVDAARLQQVLGQPAPLTRFTVLAYHTPDLAPEADDLGVDLQLSGHTHGGQVRLPGYGALFSGSLYGKLFEVGRKQVGHLTLYVTRGLGLEGKGAPRVRFLCPPEIILWELHG